MKNSGKLIGTIFIVAGTTIGASMLALPLVAAKVGMAWAFVLMVASWAFMLTNAHIILRMMAPYPKSATFRSIAKDALGPMGKHVITGAMMFLFYSLLSAYGAGATNILLGYFPIGQNLMTTLLFLGLGSMILWSDALTDYLNRILFTSLLVFVLVAMFPLWGIMTSTPLELSFKAPAHRELLTALLIYITSFGFHGSIASLVKYNDKNMARLKKAFFWGTLLAVVLYIIWMMMTVSILSVPNLHEVSHVIEHLTLKTGKPWVGGALSLFALVAILTSFIGVGMGLSNDFHDLLKRVKLPQKLLQGFLTFLPPYLLLIFNASSVFIKALEYAGVALMFIAVLMPNLIVLTLMNKKHLEHTTLEKTISYLMLGFVSLLIPCYFLFG